MDTLSITLIIATATTAIASLIVAYIPRGWSSIIAYAGLWCLFFTPGLTVSAEALVFWGVAALIALGICTLLPKWVSDSRKGVGYIVTAAIAGTLVGMLISSAGLIIGAVLGAFCGALAFSRTPAGAPLKFPSSEFINYMCAKGLPTVVTTSIAGIVLSTLYHYFQSLS